MFSLDIDDVIAGFTTYFFMRNGLSKEEAAEAWKHPRDYWYSWLIPQTEETPEQSFNKVFNEIKKDDNFWLGIPVLDSYVPPSVKFYLTSRECSDSVTEEWLRINGFPKLEVVNSHYLGISKAAIAKARKIEGHIDDKSETFIQCIKEGLTKSYLVSRPWNIDVETPRRIYRLEELDWRL